MKDGAWTLWPVLRDAPSPERSGIVLAFCAASLAELAFVSTSNTALAHLGDPYTPNGAIPFIAAVLLWYSAEGKLYRRTAERMNTVAEQAVHTLVDRIRRAPLRRVEALGFAQLQRGLTTDVAVLAGAGPHMVQLARAGVRLLLALPYALTLSIEGAGVAAVILGFVGLGAWYQSLHFRAGLRGVFQIEEQLRGLFGHRIAGHAPVLQHAGRRAALTAEYEAASSSLQQARQETFGTFYRDGHRLNALFFTLLVILAFALPTSQGERTGALRALCLVALWASNGVYWLIFEFPRVTEVAAARIRLLTLAKSLEVDGLEQATPSHTAPLVSASALQTITLEGLRFHYLEQSSRPGFEVGPLDLTLRAGELVLVTGANGSGKSTFVKLLTGLYVPDAGRIHLNGDEVTETSRASYRAMFGLIPAEVHLFEEVHGFRADQAERAMALLERLEIAHKTGIVHGRLTTQDLSTGQHQRLAMVLTLLQDRPVLVFDEWAASQDPEYRDLFYKELLPEIKAKGQLVVVVTHDDRYFSIADRRLIFEHGRARWAEESTS